MKTTRYIISLIFFLTFGVSFGQPPCGSMPPASDDLGLTTPLICDLSGYCGNTSAAYTDWSWPALDAAFCGSIENNSFFSFVASASTVSFDIWVSNSATGQGIQIMVFSTAGPGNPVTNHMCDFQLNPSPTAQTVTTNGLTPGQTYYVMIDGFAGDVSNYVISAGTGIQVSSITPAQQSICLGNTITLNVSGGNGTYTWDPSPNLNTTTGPQVIASFTQAGVYEFTVNVGGITNGCPSTSTATITVVEQPNPNAGPDQTVCLGDPINLVGIRGVPTNTSLWSSVLPTGLTPPATATYSPSFNSLTPTVTVNQPGIYRFVFREQNPVCGIIRDTVQITVVKMLQTLSKTDVSCVGMTDGSITVTAQDAIEYSYDSGTTWETNPIKTNLGEGSYTVCSRNAIGCETCNTIDIVSPVSVGLVLSSDTLICENGTATLQATASNGTSFTYHWGHTTDLGAVQQVSPTIDSYYDVYAMNENGCQSLVDSIFVTLRPGISPVISPSITICPGYPEPIQVTAAGGIGAPYTFVWSAGTTQPQVGTQSTISPNPAATQEYFVTVSDGCETTPVTVSTTVVVSPLPNPIIFSPEPEQCEPAIFTLANATNLADVNSFYWVMNDGEVIADQMEVQTDELWEGAYAVQLVVTNNEGCVDSVTYVNLISHPIPSAEFGWNPNPIRMFNTQAQFVNQSQDGYSYVWNFQGATPAYSTLENPTVLFPDGEVANYTVTLISATDFGCTDTMTKIVPVLPEVLIYAPNSFTPDGDEFNQTWRVFMEGIDLNNFDLFVYNRWGQVVFETHDISYSWDGTYQGQIVPAGAYVWKIKAKDIINDGMYEYTGTVNIIR